MYNLRRSCGGTARTRRLPCRNGRRLSHRHAIPGGRSVVACARRERRKFRCERTVTGSGHGQPGAGHGTGCASSPEGGLAGPLRYRTGAGKWFQLQARDGTRSGVCARSRALVPLVPSRSALRSIRGQQRPTARGQGGEPTEHSASDGQQRHWSERRPPFSLTAGADRSGGTLRDHSDYFQIVRPKSPS
jgi:hypothetical protein